MLALICIFLSSPVKAKEPQPKFALRIKTEQVSDVHEVLVFLSKDDDPWQIMLSLWEEAFDEKAINQVHSFRALSHLTAGDFYLPVNTSKDQQNVMMDLFLIQKYLEVGNTSIEKEEAARLIVQRRSEHTRTFARIHSIKGESESEANQ